MRLVKQVGKEALREWLEDPVTRALLTSLEERCRELEGEMARLSSTGSLDVLRERGGRWAEARDMVRQLKDKETAAQVVVEGDDDGA